MLLASVHGRAGENCTEKLVIEPANFQARPVSAATAAIVSDLSHKSVNYNMSKMMSKVT